MISRTHRFHGRTALNYVYRQGSTVRGETVSMRVAHSKRPDYRLAVVVSKKISKSAVVRNRIRRRIFEAVRISKKSSNTVWQSDLVITVHDVRFASMPAEDVTAEIQSLLQKAKLL